MGTSEAISFVDVVDCQKLETLFEQFCTLIDSSICLFDCQTDEMLIGTGLTSTCHDFHCAQDDSIKHCQKSNRRLTKNLTKPNQIIIDECDHGMMHAAVPIIIKNQHLANLLLGQVFFQKPDEKIFIKHAKKFGYDEEKYLDALAHVPIVTQKQLKSGIKYLASLVTLMADIGLGKIESEQLQQEALNREAFLKHLIDSIPDLIFHKDTKSTYVTGNKALTEFLGKKNQDIKGLSDFDLFDKNTAKFLRKRDKEMLKSGTPLRYEEWLPDTQGKTIILDTLKTPFRRANKEILGLIGICRDITAKKEMENKIAFEHQKLQATLESIDDGVITSNEEEKILLINKAAQKRTGWSQEKAAGKSLKTVLKIIDPETGKNALSHLLNGVKKSNNTHTKTFKLTSKDKKEYQIEATVSQITSENDELNGRVIVFRDVTDKLIAEEEKKQFDSLVQQSQHLESIGVLAGGIAHDFNNILTAVLGNISLVSLGIDQESDLAHYLNDAEKATKRATSLTKQLLTFAKGGSPVKEVTSTENIVKESAEFVLHGSNISTIFDFNEDIWPINIDKNQISQVIQNLVMNAAHAMPKGGAVIISCTNTNCGKKNPVPGLPPGKYVKISVKDSGIGISQEMLPKIFEPYFTTEGLSNVKGRGLGLAIAYSIIEQHGGMIIAESTPDEGSTFTIYLPATTKELKQSDNKVISGSGKILVMDDEASIRKLASRFLTRLGYEAVTAEKGEEVLKLYAKAAKSGKPFDAVILDLTIPGGMGGKETMDQLLKKHPEVKAIVSSGYSNDPVMKNCQNFGFRHAINKPYSFQPFSIKVHDTLSGK